MYFAGEALITLLKSALLRIWSSIRCVLAHPVTWIVLWILLVTLAFYFMFYVSGYFLGLAGASVAVIAGREVVAEEVRKEVLSATSPAGATKGVWAIARGVWAVGNFLVYHLRFQGVIHDALASRGKPRFFDTPRMPGELPKNLDWDTFRGRRTTVSTVVGVSRFIAVIHNLISSGVIDFTAINSVAASVQLPVVPPVPSSDSNPEAPRAPTGPVNEAPINSGVPSAPTQSVTVHLHGLDLQLTDVDSVTIALYIAQLSSEMGIVSANQGLADIHSIIDSAKTLGESVPVEAVRAMGPLGIKYAADIVGLPSVPTRRIPPHTGHLLSELEDLWYNLIDAGAETPYDFWGNPSSIIAMARILKDYYWGYPIDKGKPPL